MSWPAATGAVALALAVAFGAFGAHGLRNRLDPYAMGVYEKAVFYHFIHALGLLVIGIALKAGVAGEPWATRSSISLVAGILLFSGSLYALALTGIRGLGAVTPFGGVAFILGWCFLALSLSQPSR